MHRALGECGLTINADDALLPRLNSNFERPISGGQFGRIVEPQRIDSYQWLTHGVVRSLP